MSQKKAKSYKCPSCKEGTTNRLLVRLKPEVHAQLRELARKHHRSLNQEINFLLEMGVDKAS